MTIDWEKSVDLTEKEMYTNLWPIAAINMVVVDHNQTLRCGSWLDLI